MKLFFFLNEAFYIHTDNQLVENKHKHHLKGILSNVVTNAIYFFFVNQYTLNEILSIIIKKIELYLYNNYQIKIFWLQRNTLKSHIGYVRHRSPGLI